MVHRSFDKKVPKTSQTEVFNHPSTFTNYKLRYLFAREPFDRALSGYFDKVARNGWLGGRDKSLKDYFKVLIEKRTQNDHFIDQLTVCDPCRLNVTFLGRTETFAYDFGHLVNNLTKMHETVNLTISAKQNKTKQANKSRIQATRFRTLNLESVLDFIWAYRFDYIAYGYNPYRSIEKFLKWKKQAEEEDDYEGEEDGEK